MGAMWAMAVKDLRLLARDRANFFFTFIFPVVFAVFFGMVLGGVGGGGGGMKVAVVNEDGGNASVQLVEDMKQDEALRVRDSMAGKQGEPERALTRADGEALVRGGKVTACVIIPKGFEDTSGGLFSGQTMELEGIVDPSRKAEAGLLTGKLNELGFKAMARTFDDAERLDRSLGVARARVEAAQDLDSAQKDAFTSLFGSVAQLRESGITQGEAKEEGEQKSGGPAWTPIKVSVTELEAEKDAPRSGFEITFGQGVVWGLFGCVAAFGSSLAWERQRGTLMRLSTAPVAQWQVLVGKATACFVGCMLVQVLLMVVLMPLGLHVERPAVLGLVFVVVAVGFTGVMMAIAGLASTEGAAAGMGRAVLLVLAMIGGGTMPLFMLPEWVQGVASVSPFKWSVLALEGATWRGLSVAGMAGPLGVMLLMAVVGFVVGVVGVRRMGMA